jgi:putative hydrolase of the HAD superfamily
MSKIHGLFPKVLQHLEIDAVDMVYVWDSKERDVVPASECGIFSIHYVEAESFVVDSGLLKINTLKKLEYILRRGL